MYRKLLSGALDVCGRAIASGEGPNNRTAEHRVCHRKSPRPGIECGASPPPSSMTIVSIPLMHVILAVLVLPVFYDCASIGCI
jgi:hypothetical protein